MDLHGDAHRRGLFVRGFEVLLGGTNDWLYNDATKKWETGGPGFNAVFNFLETLHSDGLTESTSDWSNPNGGDTVAEQLMPSQQVGIDLDGSWVSASGCPVVASPDRRLTRPITWLTGPRKTGKAQA